MSTYRSIFSLASSATTAFSCAIVGTGMVLFGFSASTLAASANDIALSYEADGACYCTNAALSSPSASTIVPTPVGGQSIGQICERIGEGPGLGIVDGLYDNPAYSDSQCGNGTSREAASENEVTCTGLSAPGESNCEQPGALWDLAHAFSSDNAATPLRSSSSPSAIVSAETTEVTLIETAYENSSSKQITKPQTPRNTQTDSTESNIISAASIKTGLSQKEIQQLPEAFTEQIFELVSIDSGDANAIDSTTRVLITNVNGQSQMMTQDEIADLPLADLENTDPQTIITTIPETQIAEVEKADTDQSPSIAAVVAPLPTVNSRRTLFGSSRLNYGYIGLGPTGYDFGGNGAEVDASVSNNAGLALVASAGVAEEYSEASVGVGTYFSPFPHRASDIVINAGVEFGEFDLGITDFDDFGGYISGYLRTRPIRRLELTGGGRLSSFFDGDAVFIASGALQITRGLNAFGKVEVGDNDQFSLGIRLFY